MAENSIVYEPPNIRTVALDTLKDRMETRRQRRLLLAIENNQHKIAKLDGMIIKDRDKFLKLTEAAAKNLDKARELLDKADADIRAATQLHNHIDLLDQSKGNKS